MADGGAIDDLTFAVSCAIAAKQQQQRQRQQQQDSSDSQQQQEEDDEQDPISSQDVVHAVRDVAMASHCHEGDLLARLALERVRDYAKPTAPDARHHIYLLLKRHAPDQLGGLVERLAGMSPSQLLDVLVLLDEAFGGSVAASSAVGDGFREVLLRNAVLERENAELSMQLKAMQAKPKAQQNEAAFLVADLQSKLYESLGTIAKIKNDTAKMRTAQRTTAVSTDLDGAALALQQKQLRETQQEAAKSFTTPPRCSHHESTIKELETKLQEATKRELAAKQDLLSRMTQVAAMVKSDKEQKELEAAMLVQTKSGSTQTDADSRLVRLVQERRMLMERLSAATVTLKASAVAGSGVRR